MPIRVAVPHETTPGERRVALNPVVAEQLSKLGVQVQIQAGAGCAAYYRDRDYTTAEIIEDRSALLSQADIVLTVSPLVPEDVALLREGSIVIGFLHPHEFDDRICALRDRKITGFAMELVPRISRAQNMDALSSQASIAGYKAALMAANQTARFFPMLTTAAGTIRPAKVLVIGVGVAGLQAIATAKRLGARVDAFDTRPVVEEQVKSLGARFVKINLGETGQTKDGYAKALTEEQLQKQREGMAKVCAASDVVITTAQLFGRKAPLIITADMIQGMAKGSVLVDLAVENGGNIAGSQPDQEVDVNGVRIIGMTNLPGKVAVNASQMFSANMHALVDEFWNTDEKRFVLNFEDEIIQGCVITHQGEIANEMIRKHYQEKT